MSRPTPTPKRARSSREPWKAPADRKALAKAIAAGAAVVALSVGSVLFLGRDHLGGDDNTTPTSPATPVQTGPAGSVTTPTTPATPDSSTPAGETLTPPAS